MVSKCVHALTKLPWPYFDPGVQQFLYCAPLQSAMSDNPAPAHLCPQAVHSLVQRLAGGVSFLSLLQALRLLLCPGPSCQLSSTKGDAREHVRIEGQDAMWPHVHLAALDAHIDALPVRRKGQPRQRAGLPWQTADGGIYVDDLHMHALSGQNAGSIP